VRASYGARPSSRLETHGDAAFRSRALSRLFVVLVLALVLAPPTSVAGATHPTTGKRLTVAEIPSKMDGMSEGLRLSPACRAGATCIARWAKAARATPANLIVLAIGHQLLPIDLDHPQLSTGLPEIRHEEADTGCGTCPR